MKKSSFLNATKYLCNDIVTIESFTIVRVGWHNKGWKLINADATFDQVKEFDYVPLASFHTREELWQYIKTL